MMWKALAQEKLVSFLQAQLGNYSGKAVRRLLEANLCRINGKVERFGSRLIQRGDAVEVASTWKSLLAPKPLSFDVLYEDDALKIINKPSGWVCSDAETQKAFGAGHFLVHRLDKDTTGLLILAKDRATKETLMALFEQREIEKRYLALVDGVPKEGAGMRKSLLAKKGAFQGQTIWGSAARGLTAITRWKKVAAGKKASLILCEPETGRTHQIRVHLAEMGHPLLVDRQYAQSFRCPLFIQRPLLHAWELRFSFQGKTIEARAPLPLDICEGLRDVGIEMGHLRQFLREEEENETRNQSQANKKAEKVEEGSHFAHEASQ